MRSVRFLKGDMQIRSNDILLPTAMVGNCPNPKWYDDHTFAVYPKGELMHDAIGGEA